MTVSAAEFTDPVMFVAEGYEYNIQYRHLEPGVWGLDTTEWHYSYTNKFNSENWYPSSKAVKNALAQLKATRYGYSRVDGREYRIVRRPVGEVEILEG